MTRTPDWGGSRADETGIPSASTVTSAEPLTEVTGYEHVVYQQMHYTVRCRECGDLRPLSLPQTMIQAGVLRNRHLSEHLIMLATEIQEAAR
jgi:hypothetical protein